MNFKQKIPQSKKLFKYVFVRLMFLSIIACLLLLGIYLAYGAIWIAFIVSLPLITATCLYTAMIVSRRTKELVDLPLSKMLEYTRVLKDASVALIETAKNLDQKACAMHTAADMLDVVAETCGTISSDCDNAVKQ